MEYRQLGWSGLTVSAVALGANRFGERLDRRKSKATVDAALDAGITFIDTAEAYGIDGACETALGHALHGRRERFLIATKFGHNSHPPDDAPGSRRNVRRAIEGSLRRLRTDYIDLYYLHFPDPRTPIAETLDALSELVAEGKVRYLGASNLTAWQIVDADWTARVNQTERFVACQNLFNLLERDAADAMLPMCRDFGVGFVAYSPLAKGLLTGKYTEQGGIPEGRRLSGRSGNLDARMFARIESFRAFADERGISLLEVALGALLARPEVASIVVGAASPDQLRANVAAASWRPSPEEMTLLEQLSSG